MITRLYEPKDYAEVSAWWEGHGREPVPVVLLPECAVVTIDDEGNDIACVWLYQDNTCGVAWMAWQVTRPNASAFAVARALKIQLGAIEAISKEQNHRYLNGITELRSLKKWFSQRGFITSCEGASTFVKVLN